MSLPKPYYERGPVKLFHADCLELLPHLPRVDAVVTDAPYGIGVEYGSFCDTSENVKRLATIAVPLFMQCANRAVVFCGMNAVYDWPRPTWIIANVWDTTGCVGKVGFQMWQPVLFYGDEVSGNRLAKRDGLLKSDCVKSASRAGFLRERFGHPCEKPVETMVDFVRLFSDGAVCDPFFGSGTTAVACIRTGRQCIGIELEERYCEIAAKRCDRELDQKRLPFDTPKRTETQRALFAEVGT